MIKDNNTPQDQGAQEEVLPESLDHDDLEASELESISGGVPPKPTITCGPVIAIVAVLIGNKC